MKSDVELQTTTVVGLDGMERIDGFYFLSKKPFSRSYQWHATIRLDYTYPILKAIQQSIKNKNRALPLLISGGMGTERVLIWKGSLQKAERLMFEMIKEIQRQY